MIINVPGRRLHRARLPGRELHGRFSGGFYEKYRPVAGHFGRVQGLDPNARTTVGLAGRRGPRPFRRRIHVAIGVERDVDERDGVETNYGQTDQAGDALHSRAGRPYP